MSKNKKYPNTIKAYLVCGLAVIAAASIFTISSCKKDAASATAGIVTVSPTPVTHNEQYTFFSNTNKRVGIMIEDANGNLQTIESIRGKKGNQTLSTCLENSDSWDLVYRGFSISPPCFSPTGVSELWHSWDLYLPEDVNITNDATCVARVKVGPYGFVSAPTGTGYRTTPYQYSYVETVDVGGGVMMKKWRITANGTPIVEGDYCGNQTITPTFRLKTDCDPDLATIVPTSTPEYLEINTLSIPDMALNYGGVVQGSKQIELVPNIPLCTPGCHGYWKWCTNYKLQYKLTSSSTWSNTTDWLSNDVISMYIGVGSTGGTYQVRYKGLIRGDVNTGVWSEWIQPAATVIIP